MEGGGGRDWRCGEMSVRERMRGADGYGDDERGGPGQTELSTRRKFGALGQSRVYPWHGCVRLYR
jgi:hypothetical protein